MVDPWSGPTPQTNEYRRNEPNGIRLLLDKIAALELQIKEKTSNLLGSAGIRLTRLGMFIDSSLTVDGSLAVHGNAAFDGYTTIGGVDVIADLVAKQAALTAAVADIAALVGQQVAGNTGNTYSGTVAFTTGYVTYATVTIAVPAGFSVAKVIGVSSMFCPGAGGATSARTRISGNVGSPMFGLTETSSSHAATLSGLSGGNITIATDVYVATGGATGGVTTTAFVTFLR